ncbi:MAG: hypothetical protein DIU65_17890, partial [Proteobacteria bacterium]
MSLSERDREEVEKSSAPLIEHLIELRRRLMWSIGGFFIAFLVCFFFAKNLFNLLVIPFKWATQWAGLDSSKVELIYTCLFFTSDAAEDAHRVRCRGWPLIKKKKQNVKMFSNLLL